MTPVPKIPVPVPTAEEIRSIYAGIESVPGLTLDLQGWNSEGTLVADIIRSRRPKVYVEAGVWKGRSLVHVAKLCRELGIPVLCYAVDTWHGLQGAHIGHVPLDTQLPPHWDRPTQYQQFLFNVKASGLDDCIVPVCSFSRWGSRILKAWDVRADLIYIDAAHDEDSVYSDLVDYWPILAPGGVIAGDDLSPTHPGVERALNRFCAEVGRPFLTSGCHWAISS